MYGQLNASGIASTSVALHARILARFPESGLSKVAMELVGFAQNAEARAAVIRAPRTMLRAAVYVGSASLLIISAIVLVRYQPHFSEFNFAQFVEILDALLNIVLLIAGAVVSLIAVEKRVQRSRALSAIHELRAMAHVIDMHQLAKQPEYTGDRSVGHGEALPPADLIAYLSWCTELLSLLSKLGAYYVQDLDDEVSLDEANELEDLTTGLAQKIWQKIMLVHQIRVEQ